MDTQNSVSQNIDVYAMVTTRIIELMEAGDIPWRKSWAKKGIPVNAVSKRPLGAINIILLNSYDFATNRFLTWSQIKESGGSVVKGEKGIVVVFTKIIETEVEKNGTIEKDKKLVHRYYKVFNVEQCKDLPAELTPAEESSIEPLSECYAIIEGMKDAPRIIHRGSEAFYTLSHDSITMPKMKSFPSSVEYYSMLFHQLVLSTGHETRLNRKELYENQLPITTPYSLEEMIAEMGSCYLRSYAGLPIPDVSNKEAYIEGWLNVFKRDNKFLIKAASLSQKAVEYILNPKVKADTAPEDQSEVAKELA